MLKVEFKWMVNFTGRVNVVHFFVSRGDMTQGVLLPSRPSRRTNSSQILKAMVVWAGMTMALSRPLGFLPSSIWNCRRIERRVISALKKKGEIYSVSMKFHMLQMITLMVVPLMPAWTVREHWRVVRMLSTTTHRTVRPLSLDWRTRQWSRSTFLERKEHVRPTFLASVLLLNVTPFVRASVK